VVHAEAALLEHVIAARPKAEGKPVVVGDCKAGWQIMIGATLRRLLFGPIIIGAPPLLLLGWAARRPPRRLVWLTTLTNDLGNGNSTGPGLWGISKTWTPRIRGSKQHNPSAHIGTEPSR
jgi:hypothetical protein